MAYGIDAAADYAGWAGTGASFAPSTMYLRFRRDGAGGSGSDLILYVRDASFFSMQIRVSGTTNEIGAYYQGAAAAFFASGLGAITNGKWYEAMAVCTAQGAGNAKVFAREVGTNTIYTGTGGGPGAAYTWTAVEIPSVDAAEWFQGAVEDVRIWTAALSDEEVYKEFGRRTPARTANLWQWVPMLARTAGDFGKDYSGNGRNFTANGTPSYVDGSSVPWGSPPLLTYALALEVQALAQGSFVQADAFQGIVFVFSRPSSDITTGWTTSSGTSHFVLINEETANDSDYIYASAAAQTDEVKLAAMTSPQGEIRINYRVQGIAASGKVTVSMYHGATLVKSDTQRTVDGNYTLTVTSTDYASVTDWSDIRLRFVSG